MGQLVAGSSSVQTRRALQSLMGSQVASRGEHAAPAVETLVPTGQFDRPLLISLLQAGQFKVRHWIADCQVNNTVTIDVADIGE